MQWLRGGERWVLNVATASRTVRTTRGDVPDATFVVTHATRGGDDVVGDDDVVLVAAERRTAPILSASVGTGRRAVEEMLNAVRP